MERAQERLQARWQLCITQEGISLESYFGSDVSLQYECWAVPVQVLGAGKTRRGEAMVSDAHARFRVLSGDRIRVGVCPASAFGIRIRLDRVVRPSARPPYFQRAGWLHEAYAMVLHTRVLG